MRYRFPHKSALISVSQSDSQALSEHCETTDTGWCITRYACLLSQLTLGTHLGAWFRAEVVYPSKDGHPLTGHSVE